jgi:hypothetical protein
MEPTEPTHKSPEHKDLAKEAFARDLIRVDSAIIDMLLDGSTSASDLREGWGLRAILTEDFVDSLEPAEPGADVRAKAQFDLMVDKAAIFEAAGNIVRQLEELDAAEAFALNSKLDEFVAVVSDKLDTKTPELGLSESEIILKLRGILDFSDRDYLRELLDGGIDYQDLIGTIYGMILEQGDDDPDTVLKQLGITE